jgi:hypothetical protein
MTKQIKSILQKYLKRQKDSENCMDQVTSDFGTYGVNLIEDIINDIEQLSKSQNQ